MKSVHRRGRRRGARPDSRPCAACGLAPKLRLDKGLGQFCLYDGMRIPKDESHRITGLPKSGLEHGNRCIWPVHGHAARERFDRKMTREDGYLRRSSKKDALVVALASLALAPLGWVFGLVFRGRATDFGPGEPRRP